MEREELLRRRDELKAEIEILKKENVSLRAALESIRLSIISESEKHEAKQ